MLKAQVNILTMDSSSSDKKDDKASESGKCCEKYKGHIIRVG